MDRNLERDGILTISLDGPPRMENEPRIALQATGIIKRYSTGTEAVRGIDLTVAAGESISIVGPNGAGKTTFLRILTTELNPTAGSVSIFGSDAIARPREAKTKIGVTPQEAGVFETLKLSEHLDFFGRLKGLTKNESRSQTAEILKDLDLVENARKTVGELSGGQRRRMLIGLALIGRPPLLILDEPTTGLDPVSRRQVWDMLKKVVADGTSLIFSTHYMEEAEQLSHRIAFIDSGKIVAIGTLAELQERFPHRYRVRFMPNGSVGQPETRFFKTFDEVRIFIEDSRPDEYQISTSSLEDVYFSLVGEQLDLKGNAEGRLSIE